MESVRRHIESQVLSLTGLAVGGVDFELPKGDPGLFGPDAACWKVHGDFSSMMIGGIGALLLQMLHPLALAGVWDHSNFRDDLLGRLRRTCQFISATTYGPLADAERLIERVRRIHESVIGQLPDGTPYSASDPDLLTWVMSPRSAAFSSPTCAISIPTCRAASRTVTTRKSPWSPNASAPARCRATASRSPPTWRPCVHACVATNAPAKWCGFSSTHQRPAPWPGRSAR